MPDEQTTIVIACKSSNAVQNVNSFTDSVLRADRSSAELLKTLGGLFAGSYIASFGKQSVAAFSATEEAANRFNVTYRNSLGKAQESLVALRSEFGLSERSANDMLASAGDLLTGFGFTSDAALELSERAARLGVDLYSFTNYAGGAKGATDALVAAMLGETEKAKALGVVIRQDSAEYREMVKSLMETKGYTLDMAKAETALELATRQSINAIGDWNRPGETYAQVVQANTELTEQFRKNIGEGLAPAFKELYKTANSALAIFNQLDPAFRKGLVVTGALVAQYALYRSAIGAVNTYKAFQEKLDQSAIATGIQLTAVTGGHTAALTANTAAIVANNAAKTRGGMSNLVTAGSSQLGAAKSIAAQLKVRRQQYQQDLAWQKETFERLKIYQGKYNEEYAKWLATGTGEFRTGFNMKNIARQYDDATAAVSKSKRAVDEMSKSYRKQLEIAKEMAKENMRIAAAQRIANYVPAARNNLQRSPGLLGGATLPPQATSAFKVMSRAWQGSAVAAQTTAGKAALLAKNIVTVGGRLQGFGSIMGALGGPIGLVGSLLISLTAAYKDQIAEWAVGIAELEKESERVGKALAISNKFSMVQQEVGNIEREIWAIRKKAARDAMTPVAELAEAEKKLQLIRSNPVTAQNIAEMEKDANTKSKAAYNAQKKASQTQGELEKLGVGGMYTTFAEKEKMEALKAQYEAEQKEADKLAEISEEANKALLEQKKKQRDQIKDESELTVQIKELNERMFSTRQEITDIYASLASQERRQAIITSQASETAKAFREAQLQGLEASNPEEYLKKLKRYQTGILAVRREEEKVFDARMAWLDLELALPGTTKKEQQGIIAQKRDMYYDQAIVKAERGEDESAIAESLQKGLEYQKQLYEMQKQQSTEAMNMLFNAQKYRQTAQDMVDAGSLESVRLQSRRFDMVGANGQKAVEQQLQETKKIAQETRDQVKGVLEVLKTIGVKVKLNVKSIQ